MAEIMDVSTTVSLSNPDSLDICGPFCVIISRSCQGDRTTGTAFSAVWRSAALNSVVVCLWQQRSLVRLSNADATCFCEVENDSSYTN
jgi:hypothetical protein